MNTTAPKRQGYWPIIKWVLFLILTYFVGLRAYGLWQDSPSTQIEIHLRWLFPAAGLYLLGWFPSVWFWRSLLLRMGQRPPWYATIRAYFVGHLGKYVPGKALVLVIRASLIKPTGCNSIAAALAAVYETLVFMAAGAALGLALAPIVIPEAIWTRLPLFLQSLRHQTLLVPFIVTALTIASTPFSSWLFSRIGRKSIPSGSSTIDMTEITAWDVINGVAVTSVGWVCNALSLGCTLQAISTEPLDLTMFPAWLASITLSTFAGFVILVAPGGLGVREWILVEILKDQPGIGSEKAIIAAGLLRAVWFCTELATAAILYFFKPRHETNSDSLLE